MALACRHRTVLTDSNALVARVGGQADRHVRLAWSVCVCVRACVRLWVGWIDGWIMAEVVHSYRLHQCEGSGMAGRARKLGAVQAVQAG